MAVKQVVVSDISGAELTDADHARVVVQHPDIPAALEIDVSTSEAAKLTDSTAPPRLDDDLRAGQGAAIGADGDQGPRPAVR